MVEVRATVGFGGLRKAGSHVSPYFITIIDVLGGLLRHWCGGRGNTTDEYGYGWTI